MIKVATISVFSEGESSEYDMLEERLNSLEGRIIQVDEVDKYRYRVIYDV